VEIINVHDFPELVLKHRVGGTPRTVVNDVIEINGAPAEREFTERVMGAVVPQGMMYL
jgi:hypothetical protein